jgi:Cys-tRNA(Pro)/Cys-tRNA(Cys) deacylase
LTFEFLDALNQFRSRRPPTLTKIRIKIQRRPVGSLWMVHGMPKTNAARVLDGLGVNYELREYDVDPDDLSAGTVAAKIGIPPEQLFKTLAVRGDQNGICLAVIPGNAERDLKALAQLSGNRKVEMLPLKEVQAATGYVRGGVTALACKKTYPVYIDELAEICDVISVSAGTRGLQILLAPKDYIRAVAAKVVAITKPR